MNVFRGNQRVAQLMAFKARAKKRKRLQIISMLRIGGGNHYQYLNRLVVKRQKTVNRNTADSDRHDKVAYGHKPDVRDSYTAAYRGADKLFPP
jgi:hypothetical protein